MKSNKAKRHRSVHKGEVVTDSIPRTAATSTSSLGFFLYFYCRCWNRSFDVNACETTLYFSGPPRSLEPYARSPHRHRCFKSFCCEWDRCLGTNRRIRVPSSLFLSFPLFLRLIWTRYYVRGIFFGPDNWFLRSRRWLEYFFKKLAKE